MSTTNVVITTTDAVVTTNIASGVTDAAQSGAVADYIQPLYNSADVESGQILLNNNYNSVFQAKGHTSVYSISCIVLKDWISLNKLSVKIKFTLGTPLDVSYRVYKANKAVVASISEVGTIQSGTVSDYELNYEGDGYSVFEIDLGSEVFNTNNDLLGLYITAERPIFVKSVQNPNIVTNGISLPKTYYGNSYNSAATLPWGISYGEYPFLIDYTSEIDVLKFKDFIVERLSNQIDYYPIVGGSFVIPDNVYMVNGDELNFYLDSLWADYINQTNINVTGSNVTILNNRVVYKPTTALADFYLTFKQANGLGNYVSEKLVKIITTNKSLGSNKVVLHIGDSLTESYPVTSSIKNRLVSDGGGQATFIGFKTDTDGTLNQGTAGWLWASYLTKTDTRYTMEVYVASHNKTSSDINSIWTDGVNNFSLTKIRSTTQLAFTAVVSGQYMIPTGALTWVSGGVNTSSISFTKSVYVNGNPFYDKDTNKVSLTNYCAKGAWSLPDIISIYLGTNDIGQYDVDMTDAQLQAIITNSESLINILTDSVEGNPSAKIMINLIPYGSGTSSKKSFRERAMRLNKMFINKYDNSDYPNVYINATSFVIDRTLGYPALTGQNSTYYPSDNVYESNQVHYNSTGSTQVVDQIYRGLKYLMNL